jgi:hypothetical protein
MTIRFQSFRTPSHRKEEMLSFPSSRSRSPSQETEGRRVWKPRADKARVWKSRHRGTTRSQDGTDVNNARPDASYKTRSDSENEMAMEIQEISDKKKKLRSTPCSIQRCSRCALSREWPSASRFEPAPAVLIGRNTTGPKKTSGRLISSRALAIRRRSCTRTGISRPFDQWITS